MNRRHFIGTLAAVAAGIVLDPDRALWVPGQRAFILPPPQGWRSDGRLLIAEHLTRGDIVTIEGLYAVHPLTGESLPFLQQFVVTAAVTVDTTPGAFSIRPADIHPCIVAPRRDRRVRGFRMGRTVSP